jgi:5'-deoxynucleotidase YfbR-like HD superfamily hydrolase
MRQAAARLQGAGAMSSASDRPPRAWQRMLSGRRLDLLNPSPGDVDIGDIAHGLARVARWNGQTSGAHAFSVAQHAIVVEAIASALNPRWTDRWRLAALLHDASEYVIGDLISPFKSAIGLDYKAFENRILAAIHARYALPVPLPADVAFEIKRADRIAAFHEATELAGFGLDEARPLFGPVEDLPPGLMQKLWPLQAVEPAAAESAFLARFHALTRTGS